MSKFLPSCSQNCKFASNACEKCPPTLALLFGLISGIRCLWSNKDRRQCDSKLTEKRRSKIQIGTIIRCFGLSGGTPIAPSATFSLFVNSIPIFAGTLTALCANSALATPSYVQGNYAVPQNPQTTVTVPYTKTQTATHLNVVVVGWNDTRAQISSMTDTAGNIYHLAVGPTQVICTLSQSVFYAKKHCSSSNRRECGVGHL